MCLKILNFRAIHCNFNGEMGYPSMFAFVKLRGTQLMTDLGAIFSTRVEYTGSAHSVPCQHGQPVLILPGRDAIFIDTSTVARHITSANQRWVCWKNSPSVDHVPIETSIFREFPASHVWLRKDYFPIKTCPSPRFTPSEDQWARNSAHSDFSFTTSQLTSTNSRHLHKSTLDI